MQQDKKRVISKIYSVEMNDVFGTDIIKLCSTKELAEYYRKLLQPKYWEAFEITLSIGEYPLVHFKSEKIKISEHEYIEVLEENLEALEKLNNIKKIINK